MRQIRFRGMPIDGNQFVYGYYVNAFPETPRIVSHDSSTPIKTETLGQFTGLKDCKGIDIYEGDIIEATERRYFLGYDKGLQTIRFKSPVVYEYAEFVYSTTQENDSPLFNTDGIRVIGNIHELNHTSK